MRVQNVGLSQAEKMERNLRKAEAQVYMITYTRTALSKFASYWTRLGYNVSHRYQSPFF
ncbi:hypothetical protein NV377_16535 [Paenibacillus sp. T3-5-0-4]|nr:hypothetical protein [Paenibacillus endoradicis]